MKTHHFLILITASIFTAAIIVTFLRIHDLRDAAANSPKKQAEDVAALHSIDEDEDHELSSGLEDWALDDRAPFGQWLAKSSRIIHKRNGYQVQFKDAKDPHAQWGPLFEGDSTFEDIETARLKLRRAWEIKKETTDAVASALADHHGTPSPSPTKSDESRRSLGEGGSPASPIYSGGGKKLNRLSLSDLASINTSAISEPSPGTLFRYEGHGVFTPVSPTPSPSPNPQSAIRNPKSK